MVEPGTPTHDLSTLLRRELDDAVIDDLTRLSGGASRETWRFRADDVDLVIQRQRAGDERDMAVEADVVRAAGAAGVPAPRLISSGLDPSGTTAHMILEAVDGETIARRIQRDDEFAEARRVLTAQLGEALARVHQIDPATVSGLDAPDQIERYTEVLDAVSDSQPVLELVRRWLIRHRPPPTRQHVVHGDFRLGNVIVGPEG
ncbi:MAG: phosphotransferase family protein, partial [Ilumatobacter sp.]